MEDILPYMLCCKGQVSSCQQLYELRPSDNGEDYNPPSVGKIHVPYVPVRTSQPIAYNI